MVEQTTEPVEFVIVDSLGNKMVMMDLTPSPEDYRRTLSRLIRGGENHDAVEWAKTELARVQHVKKWFAPRYECVEINMEESYATIKCMECDRYLQGEVSEDQLISSEFFLHFSDDWELVFRENVNDGDTLDFKKMRNAAVKRAIIDEGWGHDDDYHEGSYKTMSFRGLQ